MSTFFIPRDRIPFDEIKKLDDAVWLDVNKNTKDDYCCLTDGVSYLWALKTDNGWTTFERYGHQENLDMIIGFIEMKWFTELISEHDEEFEELSDSEQYSESYIKIKFEE